MPAQLPLAQEPASGIDPREVVSIPTGDRTFKSTFSTLLLGEAETTWRQGWALAADVGAPVAPLLRQMHGAERSSTGRRVLLLGAWALAAGDAADEPLLELLESSRINLEERLMALLILAAGPERTEPRPRLWGRLVGRGRPEPVVVVAAYLAASRFSRGAELAAPPDPDDPGQVAAALFAGVALTSRCRDRWLRSDGATRDHEDLVWRGSLLGGGAALANRERALAFLSGRIPATALVRQAAALGLSAGAARDLLAELGVQRPPGDLLELLAVEPRLRRLMPGDWLRSTPAPLDDDPRRLAVLYVLGRPPAEVIAEAGEWRNQRDFAGHVCLALAWRLLADGEDPAAPFPVNPADVPEAAWVRWALGKLDEAPAPRADPVLDRALALAHRGQLPRPAARRILEDALWRRGSHPGLGRWHAERRLIRDLLFTGSFLGMKIAPELRQHERYLPKGITPTNLEFFPAAYDFFEFVSEPRPPVPAACRLR